SVESLYRRLGEVESAYFDRLTKSVAAGIVHFWYEGDKWDPSDAIYTAVSPWDNYLLWLLDDPQHEFIEPDKAIERGYGFCSQVARIVYSILDNQGISSKVLGYQGHVVAEANGQILDADYGVYIPHSALWMQTHPEAVSAYYRDFDRM